jgi:chemotaxis signal transduction protein
LPDAPPYVRGVINLRGQVMPVIDLSERLGKGVAADSARQVIIVVEHHDDVAGLLVDAVCDSFIVSADGHQPAAAAGRGRRLAPGLGGDHHGSDDDRAAGGRGDPARAQGWPIAA